MQRMRFRIAVGGPHRTSEEFCVQHASQLPHALVRSVQIPGMQRQSLRDCVLPTAQMSDIIFISHPSHRSLPRKVTCIMDGFFFCARLAEAAA